MAEGMRLNRFIATSGHCSRRRADELIEEGRVSVNGQIIIKPGLSIDPEQDRVVVEGKRLRLLQRTVVLLMNKPRGIICTARDEKRRKTVMDLIDIPERVVPVGRLDADSAGALLLTNDGDLLNMLTHPRHHVPKEYIVLTNGDLSEEQLERFARGMKLDGKKTLPCEIERIGRATARPRYKVVLREGRNRQIRRMMSMLGFKVQLLKRRKIGPLELGKLGAGEWRFLEKKEIDLLRSAVQPAEKPVDKSAEKSGK
jgi:23S rRNA pseudouridine2605 synthase